MAKRLLYYIFTTSISFSCFSQWQLIERIELTKSPQTLATDVQGYLYIGFKDGSLVKYDQSGEEILNYSLSNQSPITLIEPQFQLRTFLFYFDNQVITILDRFNGVPKNYAVQDFADGIVSLACPAPDGSFWLIENNPTILKKVDPNRNLVIVETQMDLGTEIRYMKAHQNILLILNEKQLLIFDQFGGLVNKLEIVSNHLSIENDLVHVIDQGTALVVDPFKGQIIDKKKSPIENPDWLFYSSKMQAYLKRRWLTIYQK